MSWHYQQYCCECSGTRLYVDVFSSLGYIPEMEFLGHRVTLRLTFWGTAKFSFEVMTPFSVPSSSARGFHCLLTPASAWCSLSFCRAAIPVPESSFLLVVFMCTSLTADDVCWLFSFFIGLLYYWVVTVLCIFQNQVSDRMYRPSLWSHVSFADNFSCSPPQCVFTFLMVSFKVQQFEFLMHGLSTFLWWLVHLVWK